MALRLIEMVVPENFGANVKELLKDQSMLEHLQIQLPDGKVLIRILLEADQSESVLDVLEKQYADLGDNRVIMLPVQATLPQSELETTKKSAERIDREELYEDLKDRARCTWVYLAMAILSTIVTAVGLIHNNVTIIIGAMVIAPFLGPNMALALGTTLGDVPLLKQALLTSLIGVTTAIVMAIIIGNLVKVDPMMTEIASRIRVGPGDIAVALASGCAGALACTTGVSAALIGVMVAVSLSPPLVTFGMLLGSGQLTTAVGALSLFLMNVICINLAAVTMFVLQSIHPVSWWEKERATKATRIAIGLWVTLFAILIGLIYLMTK